MSSGRYSTIIIAKSGVSLSLCDGSPILAGICWRQTWLLPVATWLAGSSWGKKYPGVVYVALISVSWSWNKLRHICLWLGRSCPIWFAVCLFSTTRKFSTPCSFLHYEKYQVCCQQRWSLLLDQFSKQVWSYKCLWAGEKHSKKSCKEPACLWWFCPIPFLA